MSAERKIPDAATARQIAAADPDRSVFVSANAGSGKTHVLVQRVINLLLRGEDPAKILCITFTKAAAANMATRVFETLAEWTTLDDAALDEKIKASTGKRPTRASARGRGGCLPMRWRRRAGSRCRPSTPSAPGCCISFPSRPTSPRASRCSTRQPPRRCSTT